MTVNRRLPGKPERSAVPMEELNAFDAASEKIERARDPNTAPFADEARTDRQQYYGALCHVPGVSLGLLQIGNALMANQGKPGHYSAADHEIIDMILPLDSGYYALLAQHTASAIRAGVRVELIEALRDQRVDILTEEERQQVEFVRAVRDGSMTDEVWRRMKARLGTERGAIEFACFVLLLHFHHRLCSALGVNPISRESFDRGLRQIRDEAAKGSRG